MENDTVRTTGDKTLVDMWIDGKLRAVAVSRRAIETFLRLPPDRAASLTDEERSEFVRTNLALIVRAAAERLRNTGADARSISIDAGQLGGLESSRSDERREGGDRRKGDRRKVDLGPPPSGERRRRQ